MQQPQLPQLSVPKPKQKMRILNWNKLPVNKILGKRNIWSLVAKNNEEKKGSGGKASKAKKAKLIDFEDMEHLFCQQGSLVEFIGIEFSFGLNWPDLWTSRTMNQSASNKFDL